METRVPFFSIITATYNRPLMLLNALKSIAGQTFKDYEVIVVNDGSKEDYSIAEREMLKYGNIRYFIKDTAGPAAARNYGIDKATGKFICFLDDDDEYLENHLAVLHEKIRSNNSGKGLYKTLAIVKTSTGIEKQKYSELPPGKKPLEILYANLAITNCISVSSEILKEYRFNTSIPVSEDFDLWTRIAAHYPVFEIKEYTAIYNIHNSSTSLGDAESVQRKHIRAFKITFSSPGVKQGLPLKYRAGILYKRYLWLSEAQKSKRNYFDSVISKTQSLYYLCLLHLAKA